MKCVWPVLMDKGGFPGTAADREVCLRRKMDVMPRALSARNREVEIAASFLVEVKAKPDNCGCQNRTERTAAADMHFSQ